MLYLVNFAQQPLQAQHQVRVHSAWHLYCIQCVCTYNMLYYLLMTQCTRQILNLTMIMPAKSCEDLRWRAVWLHLIRGLSISEIADVLFICKRSVERCISLYHATGSVAPTNQQHGPPRLLTEFEQISILQSLMVKPTMYLEELQSELYDLIHM